jgi:cation:H+ antiporter
VDIVLLVIAFVVILAGAELFTNGIEWFGKKLELAEGAVGSVLAAVGTALPETMIPIIAILFSGNATSNAVGIGAILGAPFMLSTLAMFVTGVAVILVARKSRPNDEMPVNPSVLAHDMKFFALAYAIAVGVAFLPSDLAWPRWVAAGLLIFIYAFYVREHFQADDLGGNHGDLAPLRFHRFDRRAPAHPIPPRLRIVSIQVLFALGCIVVGATVFVSAVEHLAHNLGVDEVLLALVIAPIATELPEKFNSVIWVRQGKDTLAMGNITGAMVFQSTIPTVVALVFASSHWAIGPGTTIAFVSAGIAFLSSAAIFIPMARRGRLQGRGLLIGGVFYLAYLALVGAAVAGLIAL